MTTIIKHFGRGAALAALVTFTSLPAFAQVAARNGLTLDRARSIGVSGAMSAQQDDDIATVAANAASSTPSTAGAQTAASGSAPADRVVFIEAARTVSAFKRGQPLIETGAFKVHASRRESAGMAEVHTRDTDVIYVLEASTNASTNASPAASIDLATRAGVRLVKGEWRYSDTRIIEVDFAGPGPDGQPTGAPVRTYDYVPKAGAAGFDDSQWDAIDPTTLTQRRSTGRICFNWYRIAVTIPERIGSYDPTGADVEFETAIDDYAEIWVDGELPRALGQDGGSVVAGWNAPNRLVIGRDVRPGQRIQLAVFGINGPLSNPPTNFIWMRYARLHFRHSSTGPGPIAVTPQEVNVEVMRKDADAMQAIVGANPKLVKLAEGFAFTEGPVWVPESASPDAKGALLFSDPNRNTIYRYTSDGALSVFRANSGYNGADIADYKQPGSNGLALDTMGRVTINEHGNRRVSRLEPDGRLTVLADRYQGKRLNSPNDLVYRSDGALFFTDPPFGLPKVFADPRKELSFSGIYMLHNGTLRTIATDLTGPNGIALSPDERFLYVGNWDETRKVVMRYEATPDGSYENGRVLIDMTGAPGEDAIDGIKVDAQGHLYVSGPGGLWILAPDGRHLGTIVAPRHIHNMAWGDADRQTLYLCARDRLYRIRLNVAGAAIGELRTGSF